MRNEQFENCMRKLHEPKYLSRKQINNACKNNKYLILRYANGETMAINTAIANLKRFTNVDKNSNTDSNFIGYYPCNFQEYISEKCRFI